MLYIDSEGDAELHFRIRDHLGMCRACALWFSKQECFENALADQLAAGETMPKLWDRVLSRAGLTRAKPRPHRRLIFGGMLTAATVVLVVVSLLARHRPQGPDLARVAADLHEQLLEGVLEPDFISTSDQAVDRYLKQRVPFRVHCPPRTDVNFAVKGAGICLMSGQRPAAYIVGHVGKTPVSIWVLERAGMMTSPQDGFYHCRERNYEVVSGNIADNVVVVVGTTAPAVLDRLLSAYGTYPES
jgi:hypothetical protein